MDRGGLRSRVRRFESYWGRFFEQSFGIPELRRASLTCTSRTWRPTSLPMPARPATHVSPAAGHSTTEATARRVVPRHRAACPGMAHRCGMSAVADLSILIYDRSPRRRGLSGACNCLAAKKLDQDGSESRGLHDVCLPVQRPEFCLVDHLADGLGAVMHVCRARPAAQDKDRNIHLG